MPLDPDLALEAHFDPVPFTWTPGDVIRYHLGLGAGAPECAGPELRYVYEKVLHVLGTFAAVPASAASALALAAPGLEYDRNRMIHGEHTVELFSALPVAARSLNQAHIAGVYDVGHAAIIDVAVDTSIGGELAARNTFRLLLSDEGGFGGTAPESIHGLADRPPDDVFTVSTLPQQAALYRMSGDPTPLHIDPETAHDAGFPRPTQPGLCTWGMVAKALVDRELDGAPARMTGFAARFSGPVYPGETLQVSLWRGELEHTVTARVLERDAPALSLGRFRFVVGRD